MNMRRLVIVGEDDKPEAMRAMDRRQKIT